MKRTGTILEVTGLSRELNSRDKTKRVVHDFTFDFQCGQIYSIVGPSGAGKSSLLRLLNRLDEPTSGTVRFAGKDYREYRPSELRRHIGYLFQTPFLFSGTVADNIRYAQDELPDDAIVHLLERTGLDESFLTADTDMLSGGEKQRIALARLLATDPTVTLLDEPTASLDPTATREIEELVTHIPDDRCLVIIMVTHDPNQALRIGGQALLLVNGRLVEHGPVEQVIGDPITDEGKRYRERELK